MGMLVLSRTPGTSVIIGDNVIVKIIKIRGNQAMIGFDVPKNIPVYREEIYNKIKSQDEISKIK